jgi:hypothetical protein
MKPCMENEELIPFILLAYINSQTQKFPLFTGSGTIVASIFANVAYKIGVEYDANE